MSEAHEKRPPGILIYWETFETLQRMQPAQALTLLMAMYEYGRNEKEPDFSSDPVLDIVWPMIVNRIRADKGKYEEISAKRAEAGRKGGTARANNIKQNEANEANANFAKQIKPTPTTTPAPTPTPIPTITPTINNMCVGVEPSKRPKRFSPPTVLQVQEYCKEKGYAVDAERFVDFYESKGWKVGNTPMKDWQAAVRTWAKKEGGNSNGIGMEQRSAKAGGYDPRTDPPGFAFMEID